MTIGRTQAAAQLDARGLAPRRSLGQNFVVDANTVRRIARLADIGPGHHVVEVGAGLGSLTRALAETGATVIAVEIDDHLIPILRENTEGLDNVRVIHADAMSLDWGALLDGAASWTLVANLPYNVATPLIADLLDGVPRITSMLVMVQKEVGERLVASPRSAAYGAVSVKVAYWATGSIVGLVPPSVFLPRPNVDSALVRIVRRASPAVDNDVDRDHLFALVRAGFGQRRKMLRRSLAAVVTDPAAFERSGIDPTMRAEELDVEAWGRLARATGNN
ncbi:MAG: rRNA ((1518)-N(6)/adenine(1519)-N(6))-dimethyltransferase RsmA [Actinomycetota bacterium]|jgi:16S rRNA (adenine1518-N6/adenine1519-N6)-dimethyltransferase